MNTLNAPGQSTTASRSLRQVMREHPLFFFFLIAYAGSWIMSIPYMLSVWGILKGDFTFTFILKPFVGPTLAAIIMIGITEGKAGVRRLRNRIIQWRAGWQWYLFILLGIPALLLLGIIVIPGALASFQGLQPSILVSYPLMFVVVLFGGGPLGEEIGWRGFALPRMQTRYGPLWATLLLGVLWDLWHLPDFLTPAQGGGPGTSFTTFLTNFSLFFLLVVALAIVFTWVFNHTQGSIFTAILLHAGINTPQLVWIPLFLAVDVTRMNLAALIGFGVPALLIVILTRGRLGYQPGEDGNVSLRISSLAAVHLPTLWRRIDVSGNRRRHPANTEAQKDQQVDLRSLAAPNRLGEYENNRPSDGQASAVDPIVSEAKHLIPPIPFEEHHVTDPAR